MDFEVGLHTTGQGLAERFVTWVNMLKMKISSECSPKEVHQKGWTPLLQPSSKGRYKLRA